MFELRNLSDVRRACREVGHRFFDADSMRFFQTRLNPSLTRIGHDGRVWFVTSERFIMEYPSRRLYTVRVAKWGKKANGDPWIDIDTVGEFQGFETRKEAYKFLCKELTRAYMQREDRTNDGRLMSDL